MGLCGRYTTSAFYFFRSFTMSSEKNRSDLLDAILFNDVARAKAVLKRKHTPDLNLPIDLNQSTLRFRGKYEPIYHYRSYRWQTPRIPDASFPWQAMCTSDLLQDCTTFLDFALSSTVNPTPLKSKLDRDGTAHKLYESDAERSEMDRFPLVRLLVQWGENPHHGETVAKAKGYTDIQAFLEETALQPGGWDYREAQRRFYEALGTPKTDAELEALYLESVATAAAEAAAAASAVAAEKAAKKAAKAVKALEKALPRISARIAHRKAHYM